MRKHLCIVAAAAMTVAGFGFNSSRADDAANNPANTPAGNAATQPSGPMVADADAKAIRDTLGQAASAAVARDGFAMLPSYLHTRGEIPFGTPEVKAGTKGQAANGNDIARKVGNKDVGTAMVGPFKNYDDLNNAADQFRKDWKDKYNSDFTINGDNRDVVFNDSFRILQGNIGETARTAGERVAPDNNNPNNPNNPTPPDVNRPEDRAMHMATVVLPTSDNFDGGAIRMTNYGQSAGVWKIHVRRDTAEQQIHDKLLTQLNALHDNRNNWPADQNTATRDVSARLLSVFAHKSGTDLNDDDTANPTATPTPDNNMPK
jgi:hypothetical protein